MFFALLLTVSHAIAEPPKPSRIVHGDDQLSAHLITEGGLSDRLAAKDDSDWVLFYTGEQNGDLAPCGCATRPRGGLPRTAATINASGPALFANLGGWLDGGQGLDGQPMPEAVLKNQWMAKALEHMNPAAVHVGFDDLLGLPSIDAKASPLPLVSANLHGPGIERVVYATHRGLRFAFTGVSHQGSKIVRTPGYERRDPWREAKAVIDALPSDVDRVIVFSHGANDAAKRLARSGRVDVIIDTQDHRSFDAPLRIGRAIWVRSHAQGLRLGELRVSESSTLDRKIDMDDRVPDDPEQKAFADQSAAEIKALRKRLFGP